MQRSSPEFTAFHPLRDIADHIRRARQLETGPETLAALLAQEIVRVARRKAPSTLKGRIRTRRRGEGRVVEVTALEALPYLAEALTDLDSARLTRNLIKDLDL